MNAEIITVGTELLLGDILNSNSQFLSQQLAVFGIQVLHQSTVGDNNSRLRQELEQAMKRSDLIVLTGGLGPTPDDLTRETVSEALGLPLTLHEESYARIVEYFQTTGKEMTENNRKQAMLPAGCTVFPNDHGTAPGCAVERYGQRIILLPGPPRELIPMFSDYVAPYLSKLSGGTIFSHTIGVFGVPESAVAERLADLLAGANPTVAPYAKEGEVILRVTARATDEEAARAMCEPVVAEIRQRLGINVYGVDSGSLQKAVVQLLQEKNMKIATAESCTAGLLSGRLTEVPGASSVFECGIAAYSAEIKHNLLGVPEEMIAEHGTVSPEVASAMAVGALKAGKASIGIGITGVAGPDPSEGKPVGTVYIALADEKRVWVKKIVAAGLDSGTDAGREHIRFLATSHALDLARRYLEAMPTVMAGGVLREEPAKPAPAVIPSAPTAPPKKRPFLAAILPWKGDGRAKLFLKTILLLLVLLLIAAGCVLGYFYVIGPNRESEIYGRLQTMYRDEVVVGSAPEGAPEGMLAQFYTLYSANEDVRGWLHIEGTSIDYPVMQSPNPRTDPDYYAQHSFDRQLSLSGTPYFSASAAFYSAQSVNRSLTIYGNNTGNSRIPMFSELLNYKDIDFLQEHPLVEMNTIYQNARWKIFAVMLVSVNGEDAFDYTRTAFADEVEFLQYVAEIQDHSLFVIPDEAADVQIGDSLLMLSTSAGSAHPGCHFVVAARQVRPGESLTTDYSGVTLNADVILPGENASPSTTPASESGTTTTTRPVPPSDASSDASVTSDEPQAPSTTNDTTTSGTTTSSESKPTETDPPPTETDPPPTEPSETTRPTEPEEPEEPVVPVDPVDPPDTGDLPVGRIYEAGYMSLFTVTDSSGVLRTPKNKSELQLYLAALVWREVGGFYSEPEAIKAQAVAAYTCAIYEQSKTQLPSFNPFGTGHEKEAAVYEAVGEVLGVKIIDTEQQDSDAPIRSVCYTTYFAMSCGVTADNDKVNWASLPYLVSVKSPYETETLSGFETTVTMTLDEMQDELDAYASDRWGVTVEYESGDVPLFALSYTGGEGNYVYQSSAYYVKNGRKTYLTGQHVRLALGLRSPAWEITSFDGTSVTFRVRGYGHGVGMSQNGAYYFAKNDGWTYQQILTHFYSLNDRYQIVAPKWE